MAASATPGTSPTPVTVLGLGDMGTAIARAFLDNGHPTTVWNRTTSKATPLLEAGATAPATATEAVAASPLVVLCVLNYAAVDEVLSTVGDALPGRTLVNVTSGSPAQARATGKWVSEHGAEYVDGGVMGDAPDLGTGQVVFTYSGSRTGFEAHEATLRELGTLTYYGTDAGLASVEFMAQVGVLYEMLIGFLHTLQLVQKEGVDPAEFATRVAEAFSDYPQLLSALGEAVRDSNYLPDLGSLSVQAPLMDDLIEHRRSLGVDTTRMREVKELMDQRVADGHGDQGFSSLITLLQNP